MNTADIISKLRAQAAELTSMADALEAAIPIAVGTRVSWERVPAMTLVADTSGDYCFKGHGWRDWVGVGRLSRRWTAVGQDAIHDSQPRPGCLNTCRIIALGLTGHETADDIRAIVERFNASREANT